MRVSRRTRSKSRFVLVALVGLASTLPFVAAASAAPEDQYGATIQPAAVQPALVRAYTVGITNRNKSTDAANHAHVTVPGGFALDGASLSAATSASGTCSAASWTATLNGATSTIDVVAPPSPAGELCPGGTLKLKFKAAAPASEASFTWTTTLSRDTAAFSLQGAQPTVTVDGTPPPPPTISTKPGNPSNSPGASFAFADADATASFRCRLDGGAFAACASPKAYAGLTEGVHTFGVKAVDRAGNQSAVTSFTWSTDLTPPPTPALDPKPPTVTASTSASFSFTDAEAKVSYFCKLDAEAFSSCASPKSYPGPLAAGSHVFQVKARDPAGNESAATSHSWTIDLTNPVATIDPTVAPRDPTSVTSAAFAFSSNKSGSTFTCQLDGGAFSSCVAPVSYSGLADGKHTFAVKATDALGNVGLVTLWQWTVDTVSPSAPAIVEAPRNPTNIRAASFTFSGAEAGLQFACGLDGGALASCTSPTTYPVLADGPHAFVVRAADGAGNTGPTTGRNWVVDTVPPKTTIDGEPPALSDSQSATFGFTSSEALSTFSCSLDSAAFAPCSSPRTYTGLGDGVHVFHVRATDRAGNTDPSTHSYSWRVAVPASADTTPPPAVRGLKRSVGYRFLKLRWSPPKGGDFDHVEVLRSHETGGEAPVYAGKRRDYVDRRFQNGTYFRYRIRSYDRAGNASRAVRVVVPASILLRSPGDRKVVKAPPLLLWAGARRASYYNVQVYVGSQKLLSAWPARARLHMGWHWAYDDRSFR